MKYEIRCAVLTLLICSLHAKIMRNNALMTKMISHFQQDNNLSTESARDKGERGERHNHKERRQSQDRANEITQARPNPEKQQTHIEVKEQQSEKVLNLMQNVLCRNFPSIPCKIIMQDHALSKLIERSIHQIAVKKQEMMDHTTPAPREFSPLPTLFPVINSEDLSNFLEVSNTGYFKQQNIQKKTKKKKLIGEKKVKNLWSHEKPSKKKLKGSKDTKHGTELFSGRKKMRKFYPHKIKYKDKSLTPGTFRDYRDNNDKGSLSTEMSDGVGGLVTPKNEQLGYKVELSGSPVWRIDYMKHGVPSMNMFEFDDGRLGGKLMKTGSNVIADENGLEQSIVRKEVLHPDVYIKKNNFVRKAGTDLINSEVMD